MSIILGILTFVLILVSLFLILVVLAQKAKDGGMGATLGGGAAEAAFGADTGNVLSKATINATIAFFVLGLALYLGHIYERNHAHSGSGALPTINVPAAPAAAPVTTAPVNLTPTPATAAPTTAAPAATTPAAAPTEQPKKP